MALQVEDQLFVACENGQLGAVKNLVNQTNINLECRDGYGDTPLQVACYYGHLEIVRYLAVDKKCDAETRDNDGNTPLNSAAMYGYLNILKLLVDDIRCDPTINGYLGRTPLHDACQRGHLHIARYLIDEVHVNPLCRDDEMGSTPLHLASQFGHTEIVSYLTLEKKIDAECTDNNGDTPLHRAAINGHLNIVKLLVDDIRCDPTIKGYLGRTPLHSTCEGGHLHITRYLIDEVHVNPLCRDDHANGATPLHLASQFGHTEIVRYLTIEKKIDAECTDNEGDTPLHDAARSGHLDIVKFLVDECHCDPMCKDHQYGRSPLHDACQRGHLNVVQYLIDEHNVDASHRDTNNVTPLHMAAKNRHTDVVKYLVGVKKCDPAPRDIDGKTPYDWARKEGHMDIALYLEGQGGGPSGAQKPRPTVPDSPTNTASAPTSPPQESDREPLDQQSLDSQSRPQREGGITADGQPADKVAVSQRFKEAMAEGFVESRSAKGIMMGVAGSGKTCSMCVILEETPPPPEERQSTPLAQRPVQAVRFDAKSHSKLRQVKTKDMKRRLAAAINAQIWERKLAKQKQKRASTTQSESSRPQASSQTPSQSTSSPDPEKEKLTSVGKETTSTSSRHSKLLMEDAGTQEELLSLIEELKPLAGTEEPLLHSDFVYIIDTGGQPMFHEVLPVFLRNASLCMFVIKLCERLDKIPDIEYFERGSSVCEPVPATQTNEQILKHCVTTIHSHSGSKTCPSILVIGTHRDVLEKDIREGSCSETLQEKNQKVREILLPEFERNVVYFSDSSAGKWDLIFPINAQNPGKDDWKVAELIHDEITLLIERTPSRPIPLRWYALELTLRDIAEKLDKLVLSWEEAFSVARQKLLFSEESFNEAVEYLDDLNIILYYKDILPRVIFCDLSVLIEKISELAKCSYGLRNPLPGKPRAVTPEWKKFEEFGVISKHLLESEQLQKHFRPDLFTPADLIKLFKKLLLLADVSSSASEYFMPCLLPTLPSAQVEENRVSPSAVPAPLIVKLPSSTPRHGVFCSLISFLQSDENGYPCKWNIKTDQSFTPECLFRNCAKFEVPKIPATITLIDSTDFIEVHVDVSISRITEKFRHQVHLKLCCNVQEALLAGLKRANSTLGYSVTGYGSRLRIAFACPQCEGCDVHAAEVEDDALVCDEGTFSEVQDNHRIWFTAQKPRPTVPDSPTNTASAPTSPPQESDREPLAKRPRLDIHDSPTNTASAPTSYLDGGKPDLADAFRITFRVAKKWKSVGTFLKVPPHWLDIIDVPQKDFDDCLREMLSAWLTQIDPPPTWRSLANAVGIINPTVAKEIEQQYLIR